jgi:hypothetical protein
MRMDLLDQFDKRIQHEIIHQFYYGHPWRNYDLAVYGTMTFSGIRNYINGEDSRGARAGQGNGVNSQSAVNLKLSVEEMGELVSGIGVIVTVIRKGTNANADANILRKQHMGSRTG